MIKKIFKSLVFSLMLSAPLSYAQNNFKALNFNDAFTIVKGTGARKIALFSDPHCPYSKSFEAQLSNVSNTTVYVFIYPILGGDSIGKATSIWCSPNKAYMWQSWMLGNSPPAPMNCQAPIYRNIALGNALGMIGTPSIMFEDGTQNTGIMNVFQLEEKFNKIYNKPMQHRASPPNSSGNMFK